MALGDAVVQKELTSSPSVRDCTSVTSKPDQRMPVRNTLTWARRKTLLWYAFLFALGSYSKCSLACRTKGNSDDLRLSIGMSE